MARRRWFSKLLLFLLLLILLGVVAANVWRLSFETPEKVHGSVVRVRNAFSDFYAAKNGSRVLLFDAGTDPFGRALDGLLKEMSSKRDDVSDVFLTHGHGDHFAGALVLKQTRIHAGAKDEEMVASPLSAVPFGAKLVASILFPLPGGIKVTDPLEGPSQVPVGAGQSVQAIPFPGHTPGSYLYLWEGVLFVGDSLNLKEGKLEPAVPPVTVDVEQNRASIVGLKATLGNAKVETICTAHGACTPKGQAMKMLDELVARIK